MAISKIQLGNGDPQEIRDAKSLHYIGHAESGITPDQSGIYHSAASITIGTSVTVQKYDYVTLGTDNINLVCVDTTGSGEHLRSQSPNWFSGPMSWTIWIRWDCFGRPVT